MTDNYRNIYGVLLFLSSAPVVSGQLQASAVLHPHSQREKSSGRNCIGWVGSTARLKAVEKKFYPLSESNRDRPSFDPHYTHINEYLTSFKYR
jgi:hypothetical protein